MSNTNVSPSRMTGYADAIQTLVARDGLVCFLCGKKHATVHTMQSDVVKSDVGFNLDNTVLVCKPCAKRRNGKPLSAYWKERLSAAAAELAHIETIGRNKDVVENLRTLLSYAPSITPDVPHAVDGTGSINEDDDWSDAYAAVAATQAAQAARKKG